MRYVKDGLVREPSREVEVRRLLALGYKPMGEPAEEETGDGRPVRTVMVNNLMRQTVEQLRELCLQRGMEPPANVKKAELAEAVAEYDLSHYGGERDG